jgi:cytochrome c oxidase subunit 2
MTWRRGNAGAVAALLLGGCGQYQHFQSTFGNAGVDTRNFNTLFIIFLIVCGVMYAAVIAFLLVGIARRRRIGDANVVEQRRHHESDPLMRTGLIGWGAAIGVGLIGLAIASFVADRGMADAATNQQLSITIIGKQWWWDVTYNSADASKTLRTANEIHLPVGVPVRILLRSDDVIHSFWVPSLTGKQDLIPGRENDVTIVPEKIGIYRGLCAEFCGTQHAHMAFVVDVDSYADFLKWWHHQLEEAPVPTTPLVQAGYNYVTTRQCAMCHNIAGTSASGQVGPDLTHLASRRTIAAGTLPMSKGNLYGWVEDPQSIKPGNHMPTIGLEPNDLHAVVAYLETLK